MSELLNIENYELPNGSVYSGEYIDNYWGIVLQGKGEILFPNGDKYNGEFVNGNVKGYGKYTFVNGDVHYGWFPDGLGYLNQKTKMFMGTFIYDENALLDGWGIHNTSKSRHFGWWKDGYLVQDETLNLEWIFERFNNYYENLVHIYSKINRISFGIPQKKVNSIINNNTFNQPFQGFLFDDDGNVWVGDILNFIPTGWLVKYGNDKSITYGKWENGELVEKGNLSNFQAF